MSSASIRAILFIGITALAASTGSPKRGGATVPPGPAGSEIAVALEPLADHAIPGGSVDFTAPVTQLR